MRSNEADHVSMVRLVGDWSQEGGWWDSAAAQANAEKRGYSDPRLSSFRVLYRKVP